MQQSQQQLMHMLNQGAQALNSGDAYTAEKNFLNVLKYVPNEPNALFLLGGVRKQNGDMEDAKKLMLKALDAHPNPAQVHNSLGNIYRETGETSDAVSSYNAAIKCDPEYAEAFFNRGLMHHADEKYADAAKTIETALSKSPRNPSFMNALGTSYKELSRMDDAERMFKSAISLQPNYVKALNNLGALLRKQYRFEEAIEFLQKAIQIAPKVVEPRFILANIYYELGDFTQADEAYRTIIAIQPDFQDAHESLNRLYWEHGKTDLYGKSYIVGIKACPHTVELCEKHLLALENVGRIEEALDYAKVYLDTFPSHAGLHQKAARLYAFNGNADTANDFYKSAIDLDPDSPSIRMDASKHMLQTGEFEKALTELSVAENFEPDNQRLWAYRGLCWRMLGDERHEWLNSYNTYIRPAMIEAPKGFSNNTEFLQALKADLKKYHTTIQAPVDQTLHGGSQTHGMLFDRPDTTIHQLKQALLKPINAYINALPGKDSRHPLLRRNTGVADFATSWSVWLKDGGFHVNHVHTMGWVSSSFYIDVPRNSTEQDTQHEGWIKFGESGLMLGGDDLPVKYIKPEPGMLVLFPSYMWHGTIAHRQPANRITAPFDLLPV
ncbi:tetratricopeptide repeat protein [Kordiimonas aquimaris]|uniref:tetratricopeptide repeat protein n=1 Tax=Kordiimonas aquimaris TaxID=707591 RepID=UPI0021CFDB21|nr:tetratricopeptide repeat protein [Kordiimonas aquimaris]